MDVMGLLSLLLFFRPGDPPSSILLLLLLLLPPPPPLAFHPPGVGFILLLRFAGMKWHLLRLRAVLPMPLA